MDEKNCDYILKYIIIGDSSVGKTNLLLNIKNKQFREIAQKTIAFQFNSFDINLDNKVYKINIWDTAGSEIFRTIISELFKNIVCALIVYEIDNKKSFENIPKWIEECKNNAPKTALMILIGNKRDLEDNRKVSKDEGRELAKKNGMEFLETSAKTGKNVEEVFKRSIAIIAKRMKEDFYDLESDKCGIKIIKDENSSLSENSSKKEENKGSEYRCCCK